MATPDVVIAADGVVAADGVFAGKEGRGYTTPEGVATPLLDSRALCVPYRYPRSRNVKDSGLYLYILI